MLRCRLILCLGLLSGCLTSSDQALLRTEFEIPTGAREISYQASPQAGGWFGREGLKIDFRLQLSQSDYQRYVAAHAHQWQPLPIPETFLRRLAAIERTEQALMLSYKHSGKKQPAPISYPDAKMRLAAFIKSLPPQPAHGLFQIRTAGDNIMHARKVLYQQPDRDLNDFMLALLDSDKRQLLIKVSTSY